MNKPSIGRIVIYKLTEADRKKLEIHQSSMDGGCNVSTELPAIVVAVWSDTCVNLRVLTDGTQIWWKSSINEGDQPGNWHWPVIQK